MNPLFLFFSILIIPVMINSVYAQGTPTASAQVIAPGQTDYIAVVLTAIIIPAAGIVMNKYSTDKKIDKNTETTKESMSAILADKEAIRELARVMFEFNEEKANALNNAPNIKLKTLSDDAKEFADKAAKT